MAEAESIPLLPTLETKRLVLTPLTAGDATVMYPELRDGELYAYLDAGPPESEAEVAERYRRLEQRRSPSRDERWLNWIMRRKSGPDPIGFVQVTVAAGSLALIAYTVFRRFQRQGFASEATRAVLLHLLEEGIGQFLARVDPRNQPSRRLLERLGFAVASGGTAPGTDLIYAADRDSLQLAEV